MKSRSTTYAPLPPELRNPALVRAGKIGALKRWGTHAPRSLLLGGLSEAQRLLVRDIVLALTESRDPAGVARLTDLTDPQRRVVLALIDAAASKPGAIPG